MACNHLPSVTCDNCRLERVSWLEAYLSGPPGGTPFTNEVKIAVLESALAAMKERAEAVEEDLRARDKAIDVALARAEAAEADTRRLDWLLDENTPPGLVYLAHAWYGPKWPLVKHPTDRSEIDAAMSAAAQEGEADG